jgi:hypothetical protein
VNVERMRRQLARNTAAWERVAYARRLAAMSPAHRAKHERGDRWGGACIECMVATLAMAERARLVALGGSASLPSGLTGLAL